MNSIQDKYQKIMEVMSDKTLSEGCRIVRKNYWEIDGKKRVWPRLWHIWVVSSKQDLWWALWVFWEDTGAYAVTEFSHYIYWKKMDNWEYEYEIIWHRLHIWDVLYWIEQKENLTEYYDWNNLTYASADILSKWKDKRNSLSPTDESLIDYIYNLL